MEHEEDTRTHTRNSSNVIYHNHPLLYLLLYLLYSKIGCHELRHCSNIYCIGVQIKPLVDASKRLADRKQAEKHLSLLGQCKTGNFDSTWFSADDLVDLRAAWNMKPWNLNPLLGHLVLCRGNNSRNSRPSGWECQERWPLKRSLSECCIELHKGAQQGFSKRFANGGGIQQGCDARVPEPVFKGERSATVEIWGPKFPKSQYHTEKWCELQTWQYV